MPVDQSLVGRAFPPTPPYEVTEDGVRDFAAATAGEYDGGAAPATYPIVVAFDAMNAFLEAVSVDLFRIVHGEQKFAYERPVVPGDVLTATLTVTTPAPDRGQRHHRHRRARSPTPPAPWSARPAPPWSTGEPSA